MIRLFDHSRFNRQAIHSGGVRFGRRKELIYDGVASKTDTNSDWIGTNAITIEAWIKAITLGATAGRILDNAKFQLQIAAAGNKLALTSDASTLANSAASSIRYSEWHYVVATRSLTGVANFYIDGALSGTANQDSGTPSAAATTNVFIGNRSAADRAFDGSIYRLRVYNEIWTAQKAYEQYDQQKRHMF